MKQDVTEETNHDTHRGRRWTYILIYAAKPRSHVLELGRHSRDDQQEYLPVSQCSPKVSHLEMFFFAYRGIVIFYEILSVTVKEREKYQELALLPNDVCTLLWCEERCGCRKIHQHWCKISIINPMLHWYNLTEECEQPNGNGKDSFQNLYAMLNGRTRRGQSNNSRISKTNLVNLGCRSWSWYHMPEDQRMRQPSKPLQRRCRCDIEVCILGTRVWDWLNYDRHWIKEKTGGIVLVHDTGE